MKYKNKNSGAVIDTDSVISGGAWERVPPAEKSGAPKKTADKNPKK